MKPKKIEKRLLKIAKQHPDLEMFILMTKNTMYNLVQKGGGDREIALLIAQGIPIMKMSTNDTAGLLALIDLAEELAPDLTF